MEEQKYYTPAPADIRMGLECELWAGDKHEFIPTTLLNAQIIWVVLNHGALKDYIRVPYLTAEQIDAEGWKPECKTQWSKPHSEEATEVFLNYEGKEHTWSIVRVYCGEEHQDIYLGTIRCINDLRLICKLLGI
jgi:hypothetical protein